MIQDAGLPAWQDVYVSEHLPAWLAAHIDVDLTKYKSVYVHIVKFVTTNIRHCGLLLHMWTLRWYLLLQVDPFCR